MARERQSLTTVDEVIVFFGGTTKVARLTGASVPAVCNWRIKGRFPAALFLLMSRVLRKRGGDAPPHLWSQRQIAA